MPGTRDPAAPATPSPQQAPPDRPPIVAVAAVLIGVVLTGALNAGYTTWAIQGAHRQAQSEVRAAHRQAQAEIRASQRQGQVVVHKLCISLDKLHSDQPPAGNPRRNPSRRFLQDLHAQLGELPGDIGC